MKTISDILNEHPFFRGLSPDYLQLIAGCGIIRHFDEGAVIAREGEPANNFYVLRQGKINIETYVNVRGAVVLETIEHDVVGWSWLFPPYQWTFDVRAASPVSVIALDGACLRGKCDQDPAMGYALMKQFARLVSKRLGATRMRLLDLYGH
jgi:CRP-like cAMP-binding protein